MQEDGGIYLGVDGAFDEAQGEGPSSRLASSTLSKSPCRFSPGGLWCIEVSSPVTFLPGRTVHQITPIAIVVDPIPPVLVIHIRLLNVCANGVYTFLRRAQRGG